MCVHLACSKCVKGKVKKEKKPKNQKAYKKKNKQKKQPGRNPKKWIFSWHAPYIYSELKNGH